MKRLLMFLATLLLTACASRGADASASPAPDPAPNEPGVYQVSMLCRGPIGVPQQTPKGKWFEVYECQGGVLMFRPVTVAEPNQPSPAPEPSTD